MADNRPIHSSDPSLQTLPPQNIEAEEALLCAIFRDSSTLHDVLDILTPEDFYRSANQKIFFAFISLFGKGEPVDLVTVANHLTEKKQLEEIGGATYLARLVDSTPLAVNAPHYAEIIRDKAVLRRLIEKSNAIVRRCFEDAGDVNEVMDFAERSMFEVSESKLKSSFSHIGPIIVNNIDALEERQGSKALITGVPSGYSKLDELLAGFQGSDLIILAARPSMGKTALALNFA
ncbi:MAG: replicative DNA helicase, partial [Desulfobacterales bacterium]|nr:replicative DNA helicase [Desulfobacterales bacterium]